MKKYFDFSQIWSTFAQKFVNIMSFFSKIFGRKKSDETKIGGMEDYMTLVRVYFQASMASSLGITNLAWLPDLRTFKTTLKVPTVNNKLGVGEKNQCRKMMKEMYGTSRCIWCSSRDSRRTL